MQSVYQLAMGWAVQGLNPDGLKFSTSTQPPGVLRIRPDHRWDPSSLLGVKLPGHELNHPPRSLSLPLVISGFQWLISADLFKPQMFNLHY